MTVRGWSTGISVAVAACWVALAAIVLREYWQTIADRQQIAALWSPAATHAANLTNAQAAASATLSESVLRFRADPASDARTRLDPWIDRMQRSATSLGLLMTSEDVERTMLQQTVASQERWLERDARPTLQLLASGDPLRAGRLTTGPDAVMATQAMLQDSLTLQTRVQGRLAAQGAAITDTVNRLGQMLFIALAMAIAIIAGCVLAVRRGVLRPLDTVRSHVRQAAQEAEHHHPIPGSGPMEIAAVAHDAESLRRELVMEIDQARAARSALHDDAPLVDALRASLHERGHVDVPGLEVFATARPTQGVIGGDFWHMVQRPGDSSCLIVADVSGHGWECGVLALQMRAVLGTWLAAGMPLEVAIERGCESLQSEDRTVPIVLMAFDPGAERLLYVNAGHPPPVLRTASGMLTALERTGPLVSCLGPPDGGWQVRSLPWHVGDVLIVHTDGLTEALQWRASIADRARLADPVEAAVTCVPAVSFDDVCEVGQLLMADIRSRIGDWEDDVTLVIVRRSA